ncbi:uncharacterized protein [Parasteatoda tepidariorum]|uniref:uncharacterized protein isoform X2 n=1 Tax=Parasteatoda tepidariorum TaxID=114398 RepID=UPI0039BD7FDA
MERTYTNMKEILPLLEGGHLLRKPLNKEEIKLCFSKTVMIAYCGNVRETLCVGAWAGDIKMCSEFSKDVLSIPICVEGKTGYVYMCGKVAPDYLCFSKSEKGTDIRPCKNIRRRVCLIKNSFQKCMNNQPSTPNDLNFPTTWTTQGSTINTPLLDSAETLTRNNVTIFKNRTTGLEKIKFRKLDSKKSPVRNITSPSKFRIQPLLKIQKHKEVPTRFKKKQDTQLDQSSIIDTSIVGSDEDSMYKPSNEMFFIVLCHNCSVKSKAKLDKKYGENFSMVTQIFSKEENG